MMLAGDRTGSDLCGQQTTNLKPLEVAFLSPSFSPPSSSPALNNGP